MLSRNGLYALTAADSGLARSTARPLFNTVLILAALLCLLMPSVSHAGLIWENDLGSPLTGFNPDSDDGLVNVNLGFAFPYDGATYNVVQAVTNGFLWLGGANGSQCCVLDTESDALTYFVQGSARIAAAWYDLDPAAGGTVYFNSLSGPDGNRAVFTYMSIPPDSMDLASQYLASFQLQLYDSGTIVFSYQQLNSTTLGTSPATLIGLTPANGSPVSFDIASIQAGASVATSSRSIYNYLAASGNFDLSGKSLVFTPIANGGWQIGSGFGPAAVPEPSTLVGMSTGMLLLAGWLYRSSRKRKRKSQHTSNML